MTMIKQRSCWQSLNHLSVLDNEMSIPAWARISSTISRVRFFDGSFVGMCDPCVEKEREESVSYGFNLQLSGNEGSRKGGYRRSWNAQA